MATVIRKLISILPVFSCSDGDDGAAVWSSLCLLSFFRLFFFFYHGGGVKEEVREILNRGTT